MKIGFVALDDLLNKTLPDHHKLVALKPGFFIGARGKTWNTF